MRFFFSPIGVLVLLTCASPSSFANQDSVKRTAANRARTWNEDLDFIAHSLKKEHWNAFFKVKKERFERAVADLRKRIPAMKDHEILVGFIRIAALIGDSHTSITGAKASPVCIKRYAFRRYPLSLVWCRDGLFVEATTAEHRSLLRAKLIRIGKFKLDDVVKKLAVLNAADNDSWRKRKVWNRLTQAEVLETLGIVDDMEQAEFSFLDATGKSRRVVLKPLARGKAAPRHRSTEDALASRRWPRDWYGSAWMPKSRTLYCWYDRCVNQKKRPVSAWCKQVLTEIDSKHVERVVLDLRRNSGGSTTLLRPLIDGLKTHKRINRIGHLFVLIGRRTFSAASENTLQLRQRTRAVLIGLPAGGSPNGPGAVRYLRLPNCGCTLQLSTKWIGRRPTPITIKPDVTVEPKSTEHFSGRDPVLEAALNYRPMR